MRPQQFLQGFVKGVAEYGVFVCFGDGLSALAPKGNLSNKPVASAADVGFTVGQSVRCSVISVDAAKGRISISLKPSMCMCPDASFLKSLLEHQARPNRTLWRTCRLCEGRVTSVMDVSAL